MFFVVFSCGVWDEPLQSLHNGISRLNDNQSYNGLFIVFPPVFPCGVWDEAQQRYFSNGKLRIEN